jgi:Flp pilus assembly pilin Flp
MFTKFWNDESGVIISAALVLILSICVLTMVVGMAEVATAINTELNDCGNAFAAINQSFTVTGFGSLTIGKPKGWTSGFGWTDTIDDCDIDTTCDIVQGAVTHGQQTGAVGSLGG